MQSVDTQNHTRLTTDEFQAIGLAAQAVGNAAQAVGNTAQDAERTTAGTVHIDVCNETRIASQFHQLVLLAPNGKQLKTVALKQKITRIGRSTRSDLHIDDPAVSAHHMTLKLTAGNCVVSDLSSTNGTFINGERLVGGQLLADGDELLLGKTLLRFKVRETPAGRRLPTGVHRPAPQPPGRKTARSIFIRCRGGTDLHRSAVGRPRSGRTPAGLVRG